MKPKKKPNWKPVAPTTSDISPSPDPANHGQVMRLVMEWSMQAQSGKQERIEWIEHVARRALYELLTLASKEDKAAHSLYGTVRDYLSQFDILCHQRPAVFEPIARKVPYWPGFLTIDADIKRRNVELIKQLSLGTDAELNYSGPPNSTVKQWTRDTPAISVALQLYGVVESYREYGRSHGLYVVDGDGNPVNKEGNPKYLLDENWCELVAKLEPLNRQNYQQWFKAAEPIFVERYGDKFETHKEFARYADSAEFQDRGDRRALIRDKIKKDIKQALRSLARKSGTSTVV